MDFKKILIIVIILLLLSSVYFLFLKNKFNKENINKKNIENNSDFIENKNIENNISKNTDNLNKKIACTTQFDCNVEYVCIDQKCIKPENLDQCFDLTAPFSKEECIKCIALRENDAEICLLMDTSEKQFNSVEADCFSELAIKNKDFTICKYLVDIKSENSSFRFNCYDTYAIKENEAKACNQISYKKEKEDCLNRFSVMEDYPNIDKEILLHSNWFFIAKKTNNSDYCKFLNYSYKIEKCENYFIENN